eukprot:5443109-Amphidinium_carterae.1
MIRHCQHRERSAGMPVGRLPALPICIGANAHAMDATWSAYYEAWRAHASYATRKREHTP